MSVIALKCPKIKVNVVDLNADLIKAWNDVNLDNLPIYEQMYKPAFIFDGRGILDSEKLKDIGFDFYSIGK